MNRSFTQKVNVLALTALVALMLVACNNQGPTTTPVSVVVDFINVRITGDETKLVALTCKDQESWARTQAASFKQGLTTVKSVNCKQDNTEGQYTVVRCEGSLVKSYNGENTAIDLAGRGYRTIQEDNQWRVCGYTK